MWWVGEEKHVDGQGRHGGGEGYETVWAE